MIQSFNTWSELYLNKAEAFICNSSKNAKAILEQTTPDIFEINKAASIITNEKISIIIAIDDNNCIFSFHQTNDLQAGLNFEERKIVALDGFNTSSASILKFIPSSISKTVDEQVPSVQTLIDISSTEEFIELEEKEDDEIYTGYPFMIIPAFLWKFFIENNGKPAKEIFIHLKQLIRDFRDEYENKEGFTVRDIMTDCKNLYQFLWLAKEGKVPPISIIPIRDDEETKIWAEQIHSNFIKNSSTRNNNNGNFDEFMNRQHAELTGSLIANQIGEHFKSSNLLSSSEEKGKKKFEKLPSSLKQLILNASATSLEIAAAEPCESCINFISADSAATAKMQLIDFLEGLNCRVEVDQGTISNLYRGNFLRNNPDSPSNFSFFSFRKKSIHSNPIKDAIEFQMKETSKEGITSEDISNAMHQSSNKIDGIDYMIHNIKNTAAASIFFFGEDSVLSLQLNCLVNHVQQNADEYEMRQSEDSSFATRFLWACDSRVQAWLKNCKQQEERCMIIDNFINFNEICTQVIVNSFNTNLPFSLKRKFEKLSASKEDEEEKSITDKDKDKNKRNKKGREKNKEICEDIPKEWKVGYEEFVAKFARDNNPFANDAPIVNGKKICARFFTAGYCFDNCGKKCTHKKVASLSNEEKKQIGDWISKSKNHKKQN
jgi:hypothetical protein